MRRVKIFSGSSHPLLVEAVCERLGLQAANCELTKFSNGETSVKLGTSIRDQDVFIVQSGSDRINDSLMELLIMISACKGGSAKSITAVMPYFPYSRQSKKKSHRGAIAARMVANLLSIAGINHVITVDLHAPPTQGFFGKPVDNLHAEPLIARWIRSHVVGWKDAVVVSKNPGGSKRVTSLADALKLSFGIITTDRRRTMMGGSSQWDASGFLDTIGDGADDVHHIRPSETRAEAVIDPTTDIELSYSLPPQSLHSDVQSNDHPPPLPTSHRQPIGPNALLNMHRAGPESPPNTRARIPRSAPQDESQPGKDAVDEYTDEPASEVITGRLVQGHIVDDDHPSPVLSTMSGSIATLPGDMNGSALLDDQDPMSSSFMSHLSTVPSHNTVGGGNATAESDDEEESFKNPELEHTVTLVGNVKDRIVIIMDDLIDQCGSWIAAAETVVKKGGAQKVYCIATHGLFGYDSLESMEDCECIDFIVVTNTYPISPERIKASRKLVILDISNVLSEAIRRNHNGESISQLFQHYTD
ncbi:MAG: hypothetical protein Q9169_004838 [Polycauliona sp. 2 TL-2023]